MFRRDAYRAMRPILEALDVEALGAAHFALGGATRIALAYGEVRLSSDLDFLASDARGYASLRQAVRDRGYAALFATQDGLVFPREATADQYGIRFPVIAGGVTVKIELIREARIDLGPAIQALPLPMPCLALLDVYAEKLLALSDRGADPSQFDRDLIDLAILRSRVGPIPEPSLRAAAEAYGASVVQDLHRAIVRLRDDHERRHRSMAALRVDDIAVVEAGLSALSSDAGV